MRFDLARLAETIETMLAVAVKEGGNVEVLFFSGAEGTYTLSAVTKRDEHVHLAYRRKSGRGSDFEARIYEGDRYNVGADGRSVEIIDGDGDCITLRHEVKNAGTVLPYGLLDASCPYCDAALPVSHLKTGEFHDCEYCESHLVMKRNRRGAVLLLI